MASDSQDAGASAWLRGFVEENPSPVLRVTALGMVLWANQEGRALLDAWGLEDRLPSRLAGDVSSLVNQGVTQQIIGADDVSFELTTTADGSVWLQGRGPNDVLTEQIRAARRTKSAFLANMSHELRTPLNAILGYSELLTEEAREIGMDGMLPDLSRVHRAATHLLRLINDILDVSKIEAGRVELFIESFRVMDLVDDVVETIQPLLKGNRNRLRIDVDLPEPEMRADRAKVRQVLFNLLDNACKFTADGEIVIRVEGHRGADGTPMMTFSVEDSGIGMTPDQLARLFEPFNQADTSTTRRFGGTGLGLALARLLVNLMGGEISAASTANEGSVFSVTVPAVIEVAGHKAAETSQAVQVHGSGDSTVLVIDDDPSVRDLVTRFLVKEGYRVICAPDGEVGLQVAREQRPDAITLDVMMPRIDGWEVLRRLKADPEVGDIPVVMLSIVDNTGLGFALGASDYLTKPIDRQALIRALAPFRGQNPGSVLVVDDHADIRDVIARTLQRAGWTVHQAHDGSSALAFLESSTPDVVILDLLMPGIDGFTVVDRMRADPRWEGIPVLVVTAKDLTPVDQERLRGGVDRIVAKSGRTLELLMHELQAVMDDT